MAGEPAGPSMVSEVPGPVSQQLHSELSSIQAMDSVHFFADYDKYVYSELDLLSGVMRWDSSSKVLLRIYDWSIYYTLLEPVILPPGPRGWKHVPVSGAGAAGACLNTPVVRVFEDNLSVC